MSQISAIEALKSKTMSSTEIAQLTGKQKKHVHQDIKDQLLIGLYGLNDGQDFDHVEIQGVTIILDNRGYWKEVLLDHEHTLTLMTGYDVKARHKINKRWVELESSNLSIKNQEQPSLATVANELEGAIKIANLLGYVGNQGLLSANKATKNKTGVDCIALLEIELIAPKKEHAITPSDIGVRLDGISGMKVNQLLKNAGLQIDNRTARNAIYWTPTEKGIPYAQLTDTNKKHSDGTPIKQVKWLESVIELLGGLNG